MGGDLRVQSKMRRREDGATLVEFALLAPLIFALIFGMVTGGLALSRKNSMENAVREAARLGATLDESASWATSVRQRAVQLSAGDVTSDEVCVKLVKKEPSGSETVKRSTPCTLTSGEPSSASVPSNSCVVKVWARTSAEFNFIFASQTVPLDAGAINRYERAGAPVACG